MWRPENLDCVEPLGLLALKIQLIPLEVFKRPVSNGRKLTGMSFLRGTTPILALRIGMKTLTVLIRKVRTTQRWFLPAFAFEHLQHYSGDDLTDFFSPSKFSSLLFRNPTHKTKTGTANRCATTYRKPRGPTIVMGPTISIAVRSHLIQYFLQAPFTSQGRERD